MSNERLSVERNLNTTSRVNMNLQPQQANMPMQPSQNQQLSFGINHTIFSPANNIPLNPQQNPINVTPKVNMYRCNSCG